MKVLHGSIDDNKETLFLRVYIRRSVFFVPQTRLFLSSLVFTVIIFQHSHSFLSSTAIMSYQQYLLLLVVFKLFCSPPSVLQHKLPSSVFLFIFSSPVSYCCAEKKAPTSCLLCCFKQLCF